MSNSDRPTIVDKEDYYRVKDITWCLDSHGYVVSTKNLGNGKYENLSLHRVIIDAKPGQIVDHIDRDKLNNTRGNLRFATVADNTRNTGLSSRNTTGYKGVSKIGDRFTANIVCDGVNNFLGTYDSPEDAAKAYNIKAEELFGEYAWFNDVDHKGFIPAPRKKFTSKYKGVSLNKATGKWRARTSVGGLEKHIGSYETEEEAAEAYEKFMSGYEGKKGTII